MNILVIGAGRVGCELAVRLCTMGHDVSVIDDSVDELREMEGFSGMAFAGVPIDTEKLMEAGISSCDAVLAVTGDDNMNIMVSELAKKVFGVENVITRMFTRDKAERFELQGLRTVNSTAFTVDSIIASFDDYQEEQYISYGEYRVKFYTIPAPKDFIGHKVNELEFDPGEELFAIINADGIMKRMNNYNVELRTGDLLIFTNLIR